MTAQPPADASPSSSGSDLNERLRIDLERYKAKLDFWKYVIVSGFVAVAIAAITPIFQYSTALLEQSKSTAQLIADIRTKEADRATKQEEFRQEYVKLFIDKAVDQDIELRLRFAEYFAAVSADPFREGWVNYRDRLEAERQRIRDNINALEREWVVKSSQPSKTQADVAEIEQKLAWSYKEVGYVERNRSVSTNPRNSQNPPFSLSDLPSVAPPSITGIVVPPSIMGSVPLPSITGGVVPSGGSGFGLPSVAPVGGSITGAAQLDLSKLGDFAARLNFSKLGQDPILERREDHSTQAN